MSAAVVHKHTINAGVTSLKLAAGAQVIHVAEQHGQIQLWEAHSVDERGIELRDFVLAGTGISFHGDPGRHVGSVLVDGGTFVFHIFEVTR